MRIIQKELPSAQGLTWTIAMIFRHRLPHREKKYYLQPKRIITASWKGLRRVAKLTEHAAVRLGGK
jgi:hypothetical protein